jgi:catalase
VHAVGIGATGYFVPSSVAPTYTCALQFNRTRVEVSVRFSNGTGSPVEHDDALDVRGMAVKFHLRPHVTPTDGAGDAAVASDAPDAADLISINLPVFFASSSEAFLAFSLAGTPKPLPRVPRWTPLLDKLRLREPTPPPDPDQGESGQGGVVAYANAHPEVRAAILAALTLNAPSSYARAAYHALHTFELTDPLGVVRYGRVSWEPVAGVHPEQGTGLAADYLHTELRDRLARAPVRFVLRLVLGQEGDALDNPAILWDTTRPRIVLGELVLTDLVANQESGCERLSFNPTRVAGGFEGTDDPVLAARGHTYARSCADRRGTGCPV